MKNKVKQIVNNNAFIVILFAIMSVMSSYILLKSHFVGSSIDILFHWSRIFEIRDSILSGNGLFSPVALNKFNESGSAVMTMYPHINLLPVIFFSFFIKSFVHLVYFTSILRNFLSLIIAYFACYSFNKNKWISFIFSISYVLSTMTLFYSFILMDMGVSSSLIFIPMAVFGTFHLITNHKWLELAIGMIALIFCHVITTMMVSLLVIIILIINWRFLIKKETLVSFFKCLLTIVLVTSVFWIPFIVLYLNNKISTPVAWWQLSGTDINDFIGFVFNNSVTLTVNIITVRYITTIAFVGIVVGIIFYKHMKCFDKQIFWIAIASLFLTSSLFPWNILNDTFIKNILQFSWRIFIVTQVLLCYTFAVSVIKLCQNKKQVFGITCLITFAVLCMQLAGQKEVVGYFAGNRYDTYQVIKDSQGFNIDYLPKNALKISNNLFSHQGTIDKKENVNVQLLYNGKFQFELPRRTKFLKIPFFIYNDINYQVKVDGKNAKFHSDGYSQLTLGHMNKGKHIIQVIVHKSWYDYLSYVLSTLGVIVLAFTLIRSLILKRKIK